MPVFIIVGGLIEHAGHLVLMIIKTVSVNYKGPNDREGFRDSSVGIESACSAEDPGLIPGLGRSTGEGIGCPFRYLGASLMTSW